MELISEGYEIDSIDLHADVSLHLTSMKLFMRDSYAVLENNIVFVNEKIETAIF